MLTLNFILPLASVLAIYVVRLIELGTKREIIAGKIRENLTLRLFLLAGTLIFLGSIVEFIALRPSLRWGAVPRRLGVRDCLIHDSAAGHRGAREILEPARRDSGKS